MEEILKNCRLCPRECGVDRTAGEKGYCRTGEDIIAARAALHFWEEPCISGESGSGAVFFSGCTLGCVYCQNHSIAKAVLGKRITVSRLADIFLNLQRQGALNINLVTPTHFTVQIIKALRQAKEKGLGIPVIYNTSGYERVETLRLLEGLVDVYLPDFKYMSGKTAELISAAEDYPEICKNALGEMFRQVGKVRFKEDGTILSGMIVRHLVLPDHTGEAKEIIRYLHETYGDDIFISIMNQYTPLQACKKDASLGRKLTEEEYDEVVSYALDIGVTNAYIQEGETAEESFIPEFDAEGI